MAYDFDEWAVLARTDPEGYERLRLETIEEVIGKGSGCQRALRGLQWRIDQERRKSRTPLKACISISSMMWDSFYELNDGLNRLKFKGDGASCSTVTVECRSATVLPFRRG